LNRRENLIGRDMMRKSAMTAASSSQMPEPLELNDTTACDHLRMAISRLPQRARRWRGRGIVICAGGSRYFPCAWVCINMLRRQGCELPIQLWHLHAGEMNSAMRGLVEPLGVSCINAQKVRKIHPVRTLNGWELKAFALLNCPFQEVLLLDADNVPVVDPEFLFETREFAEAGAIFWPDFGRLEPSRSIWSLTGVPYRDEPEFESGQIVLDKKRCFRALSLAMWFNEYSDFWYSHIHGDKETFHLAWRRLDAPYAMPQREIHALEATMCQHDFRGRRIFQHRNMAKWKLHGNQRISGFSQEEACLRFIELLMPHWSAISGLNVYREEDKEPDEVEAAGGLTGGRWIYERVGYDRRRMAFWPNGSIGLGAAGMELFWDIRRIDGALSLDIQSQESLTCRLTRGPDDVWRGRWEDFERMPVELRREAPEASGSTATGNGSAADNGGAETREATGRLTAARHLYRRTGYDSRPMEFRPDGSIGAGGTRLEAQWRIYRSPAGVFLDIGSAAELTCRLKLGDDRVWRGRWEKFERMPVEVYPQPETARVGEGIDVVYTWVDAAISGPDWRAALALERAPVLQSAATHNRYRSNDELRYSLRSLHAYAPWIGRVFVVTNGDVPSWLNLDCPKLRVVTHREIFENACALPTFNSQAIELNLHRIPGLGPAFLYFNDDFFLGQRAFPDDFLSTDAVQTIFFTDWDIPAAKSEQAHDQAYQFTVGLLNKAYGARVRRMLAHVPQLYRVDVLEEICGRWKREVESTSGHRFRHGQDAVLRILYAYYLLESPTPRWAARRMILPEGNEYLFVRVSMDRAFTRQGLSRAAQVRPKFLCVNDEIPSDQESAAGIFEEVREFLAGHYPQPSPFEQAG
jgi:hypothetical protein